MDESTEGLVFQTAIGVCSCDNCREVLVLPYLLPKCGHTFCEKCIEEDLPRKGRVLRCPVCQIANVMPLGESKTFPRNIQLQKLSWALAKLMPTNYSDDNWNWGDNCDHWPFLQSSEVCGHCLTKFCSACILKHLEHVRNETVSIGSELDKRCGDVVSWLHTNVDQVYHALDARVQQAEKDIEDSCSQMEEAFKRAITARKQRLLFSVREVAGKRRAEIEQTIDASRCITPFGPKLSYLLGESILYYSAEELSDAQKDVLKRDEAVSTLEDLKLASQSGKIACSSGLQTEGDLNKLLQMVENDGSVEWTNGFVRKKFPQIIRRLKAEVKIGSVAGVRNVLDALPPFCRKQIVDFDFGSAGTFLFKAIRHGHLELVRYLVTEEDADLEVDEEFPPIHTAAAYGHVEVVKFFADTFPEMAESENTEENTPLYEAAIEGHLAVLKYLFEEKQADIHEKNKYGKNALHLAARHGSAEMVQYLVDQGGDPFEMNDSDKNLPIHMAAEMGKVESLVYMLDEFPILMFAKNGSEEMPVHVAASNNQVAILEVLLARSKKNLELRSSKGLTPLAIIVHQRKEKSLDALKFLLDKGADPTVEFECSGGRGRQTLIHAAAMFDKRMYMEALLDKHPHLIHLRNCRGDTPLTIAKLRQSNKCLSYLEKRLATHSD